MSDDRPLIDGLDVVELESIASSFQNLAETPEEWAEVFARSLSEVRGFIHARNAIEIVAKSATQMLAEANRRSKSGAPGLEQADIEVLQALVLMETLNSTKIPTSPANFERFWPVLQRNVFAFPLMQPQKHIDQSALEYVVRRIRLRTVYHRNLFTRADCEETVIAIFRRIDDASYAEVGFRFSEMFGALIAICTKVEDRLDVFRDSLRLGWTADDELSVLRAISFFCDVSPMASRAWRLGKHKCQDIKTLRV